MFVLVTNLLLAQIPNKHNLQVTPYSAKNLSAYRNMNSSLGGFKSSDVFKLSRKKIGKIKKTKFT